MKFLDGFKKKLPTHSEKVDLAYQSYKPEVVQAIFPGGRVQAGKIVTSLSKIYGVDLDTSDAKVRTILLSPAFKQITGI